MPPHNHLLWQENRCVGGVFCWCLMLPCAPTLPAFLSPTCLPSTFYPFLFLLLFLYFSFSLVFLSIFVFLSISSSLFYFPLLSFFPCPRSPYSFLFESSCFPFFLFNVSFSRSFVFLSFILLFILSLNLSSSSPLNVFFSFSSP